MQLCFHRAPGSETEAWALAEFRPKEIIQQGSELWAASTQWPSYPT